MKRNKMKLGAILISILITIGIFAGCESKASEEINVLNYGANAAEGVYKEFQKQRE